MRTSQANLLSANGGAAALPARPGLLERLCPLSRAELFGALFVTSCANGLVAKGLDTIHQSGWSEALLGTFGVSVVVWVACYAGLSLVLIETAKPLSWWDVGIGAVVLALLLVPFGPLSWIALTLVALWAISSSEPGSPLRRGAWILLAVTVPMCWSRLLFAVLARWILEADAVLVSFVVGTERLGNTVQFSGYADFFQIYPACSSLANMSLALLCWVTASKLVSHRASPKDILWCGLACLSVVAVNVARASMIGLNREQFDVIHGPFGATIASWLALFLMVGITFAGLRRDFERMR